MVLAQGDNNPNPDPLFHKDNILCHVPMVRRVELLGK
jgi:hypothetical protein